MGGHVSKAHPNQSVTYAKKLHRRQTRMNERLYLDIAKEMLGQEEAELTVKKRRRRSSKPLGYAGKLTEYEYGRIRSYKKQIKDFFDSAKPVCIVLDN